MRNYLGVLAALDHTNAEAVVWLRRAAEQPSKSVTLRRATAVHDREAPGDAATAPADAVQAAEANKRLLDSHAPFASWVAPDELLPSPDQLKDSPGLASEFAKAADARWRQAVAGENGDRQSPAAPAAKPATRVPGAGKPAGRTATLSVPPVIVRLLDSAASLTEARALAQIGNLNDAMRLADASRSMRPDAADAYLVLADIFQAKGWLVEAIEALDRAAAKSAGTQKQLARDRAGMIAKDHPELPLEPRGLLTSPHFRVRFACPPSAAQATLAHLERARGDAIRTFGVDVPVVYVRLFPDPPTFLAYVAAAQKKPPANWLYAWAAASSHSPAILSSAEAGLATLSHEYAHLVIHTLAGPGDVPHWINEGIADVVKRGRATTTEHVRAAFLAGRLPRPDDVERFFSDAELKRAADNEQATLFYDECRCAASFFLNTYGDHRAAEWLFLIRRGEPARQAFTELTGITWDDFFKRWSETCLR